MPDKYREEEFRMQERHSLQNWTASPIVSNHYMGLTQKGA